MALVYSTQFYAGGISGSQVVYTVPAGHVAVVRDINVWNNSSSAAPVNAAVYSGSGGLLAVFFEEPALGAFAWAQWQGNTVVNTGQELVMGSTAGGTTAILSGFLLTLP